MRLTASHEPRIGPWTCSASIAYELQVGSKRHAFGRNGDMAA